MLTVRTRKGGEYMKKSLIVALVMLITGISQAAVKIAINGVVDNRPFTYYDFLKQSDSIGIWTDGDTLAGAYFMGIVMYHPPYDIGGMFASFDISQVNQGGYTNVHFNDNDVVSYFEYTHDYFAIKNPFIWIDITSPSSPGMLVDDIKYSGSFSAIAPELVLIALGKLTSYNDTGKYWDGVVLDMKSIAPIPEPITVMLLGLGGLILRRRR
jgi:hypothetical protein